MKYPYLEVTFRNGQPLAAYLYLPREVGDKVARTEPREAGILVDYTGDGRPIGVEITAPRSVNLAHINRVLVDLHQREATAAELAPLLKAG